jgi:hypothetical protein
MAHKPQSVLGVNFCSTSTTDTNKVLFSLENPHLELLLPVPLKPPSKPGGRHVESRMISKLEMSKVAAIKGNSKTPRNAHFAKLQIAEYHHVQ